MSRYSTSSVVWMFRAVLNWERPFDLAVVVFLGLARGRIVPDPSDSEYQ